MSYDPQTDPSNIDPMTGDYIGPAVPKPTPEQIAENTRQSNNALATKFGVAPMPPPPSGPELPQPGSAIDPNLPTPPAAALPEQAAAGGQGSSILDAIKGIKPLSGPGVSKSDQILNKELQEEKAQTKVDAASNLQTVAGIAQGFQNQSAANMQDATNVQTQLANDKSADAKRLAAIDADRKEREADIQKDLAEQMAQHIDPNRMYKNMSTGNKILGGIGLLLSGVGGAVNHGQNAGFQVMQSAINQDIEAQKADMTNRLDVIGKKLGLNRDSLSTQMDLLKAQQDTTYRSFTAGINLVDSKQKMAVGNATTSAALQQASADLMKTRDDATNKISLQMHQVQKAMEAQAATSGKLDPAKMRTYYNTAFQHYIDQHYTPEEADKLADKQTRNQFGATQAGTAAFATETPEERLQKLKSDGSTQEVGNALNTVSALGIKAAKLAGLGTSIAGKLTPGGTEDQDIVNQYHTQAAALIKSVEPRMSIQDAERIVDKYYSMGVGTSQAQKLERLQALRNHVNSMLGVRNKPVSTPGE